MNNNIYNTAFQALDHLPRLQHILSRSNTAALNTTERLFLYSLIVALDPNYCLEIGTWSGGSAEIIQLALQQIGGHLWTIDRDMSKVKQQAFDKRHVTFIEEDMETAMRHFPPDQRFDFIFIDGEHTSEAVYRDVEKIMPFLKNQTVVLFHDIYWPPVQAAYQIIADSRKEWQRCDYICRSACDVEHTPAGGFAMLIWHEGKTSGLNL